MQRERGLLAVRGRLGDLTPNERWALVGCAVLALGLRVFHQAGRPFSGDEVGTLLFISHDYGYLLTHFDTWLTMNYYLALEKALSGATGGERWVLVAPSLVAGVAAVPLVAALALRVTSRTTALVAAFLVSLNPYLINTSVLIRSYALLVVFSLGALVCFYDWAETRRWRAGASCAACAALALLFHANALYPLGFLALLFAIALRERQTGVRSLLVPMAVAVGLVGLAYLPLVEPIRAFRVEWSDTPPTEWSYLPEMAREYFGRGGAAVPSLLFLGFGTWSASQRSHRLALLGLGVLIPMALASLAGVAVQPGAFNRFLLPILPLLLLFVAEGAVRLARSRPAPTVLFALLVALSWAPGFAALSQHKRDYPWIQVAHTLGLQDPSPGEVLAIGIASWRNLLPYVDESTFVTATDFVRDEDGAARLLVVSPNVRIETESLQQQLGKVQVVTYRGESRAEILRILLRDLTKSLGGRISPTLVPHYQLVLELLPARADSDRLRYTEVYWKSLIRTPRIRLSPPHRLEIAPDER